MDESIRYCRPCDKKLQMLYDIVDVGLTEEMWEVREIQLLENVPHGPNDNMRTYLVHAYVGRKFGWDAYLINAARKAHILAREPITKDVNNSAQSSEQYGI